ncbi:MAG: hypothetical protein BJ554DRAFT_4940, partial [Olpidium bornovanus]
MSPPYTVVVPFDDSAGSREALWKAARLVSVLANPRLVVLHVTCLNAPARVPGLDGVEKASNSDIRRASGDQVDACKSYLAKLEVAYEWFAIEGHGTPGQVIESFIKEKVPECDLVIMGTRGLTGLKKWVFLLAPCFPRACVACGPLQISIA